MHSAPGEQKRRRCYCTHEDEGVSLNYTHWRQSLTDLGTTPLILVTIE